MKRSSIKKAWDRIVQSAKNAWEWIIGKFNR